MYFLPFAALNSTQRHLLAVFTATIIALVAQPVPMGVSTTVALTILALTKSVSTNEIFSGYSNPTVWLIFTAFLFATAVTSTRFGLRVASGFIRQEHAPGAIPPEVVVQERVDDSPYRRVPTRRPMRSATCQAPTPLSRVEPERHVGRMEHTMGGVLFRIAQEPLQKNVET